MINIDLDMPTNSDKDVARKDIEADTELMDYLKDELGLSASEIDKIADGMAFQQAFYEKNLK